MVRLERKNSLSILLDKVISILIYPVYEQIQYACTVNRKLLNTLK